MMGKEEEMQKIINVINYTFDCEHGLILAGAKFDFDFDTSTIDDFQHYLHEELVKLRGYR
jgi:hypothetical protein